MTTEGNAAPGDLMRYLRVPATALLLLALFGCERPFEPIQPSDRHFSIYGYLDASTDTQFIRVTPVRDVAGTNADPLDVSLKLEQIETGRSIPLSDSLFAFPAHNVNTGIDRYARNFWTTEKMQPGTTYAFTATGPDGESSRVVTRVPKDVPEFVVGVSQVPSSAGTPSYRGFLRLSGVEHLAMVNVIHDPICGYQPGARLPAIYQPSSRRSSVAGADIQVSLRRVMIFSPPPDPCGNISVAVGVRAWDIFFVLSGDPWPFDPNWTELEAFGAGLGSNVLQGTGFLGGIITRTLTFETCYIIGLSGIDQYCELVYNARSAAIEGVIADRSCPNRDIRLGDTTVFLWEDDKPNVEREVTIRDILGATKTLQKQDGVTVRTAYSDADGSYRIDALKAGVPYALSVTRNGYFVYENRVVLQAGQQLRLDLELTRSTSCPS